MRNALAQRRATTLRHSLTDSEKRLWQCLRRRQIRGLQFRRQVPIGPYIADFACLEIALVVEVDGGQHNASKHDRVRDIYLQRQGFRVLRFWNHDVLNNTDAVMQAIFEQARMPSPEMPPP